MTVEKKQVLVFGTATAGNVAGVIVAIKRKSGFWGGVGWFIVGGMAGAAIGYILSAVIPGPDTLSPNNPPSSTPK